MGRLGAHPNIVTVFDIGEENGQPYIVSQCMAGGDVGGDIEKAPEHRLPIEQRCAIASSTCRGLEFAHAKGIVHRDLKPGNVWLTRTAGRMIGDFGLAVAVDKIAPDAGRHDGRHGELHAAGAGDGRRDDATLATSTALGAMLYEMVCGRPPFVGDESVAIIGQHLNTPPVAPSWHRPTARRRWRR